MSTVLIPGDIPFAPDHIPDSPFHDLVGLSRADLKATRGLPAAERRQLTDHFVDLFQWGTLHPLLPLRLGQIPDVPDGHPRRCRSHYLWVPPDDIQSVADFQGLDDFDLVLRLFDFSAWRQFLRQAQDKPRPALCQSSGPAALRPCQHRSGHPPGPLARLVLVRLGHRTPLPRARPGLLSPPGLRPP